MISRRLSFGLIALGLFWGAYIEGYAAQAPKQDVPSLIEALKDKDSAVRQDAARALGGIGPAAKEAVPALTEALKDENAQVRRTAADALKRIRQADKKD